MTMTRRAQRVQFEGHHGDSLAGILELPAELPRAFVLFSHCFTCNKDLKAIVRISRSLADAGWAILRYDFSGLGDSHGEFRQSNFTTNREDLRAAASYLAANFQPAEFLIGHSFGGAASMSMADELKIRGVVALAAPSDTQHLATLLSRMDPNIEAIGHGIVTIGGRTYHIDRQMLDDFRSYDLQSMVRRMRTPLLAFHSPLDETVGFHHAVINCGWDAVDKAIGQPSHRSLVSLPYANHLLTSNDEDCIYVARVIDAWSRRMMR